MEWPRGVDRLCYGGDYNPEQWPEEVWAEDVALMREAGITLVTVGVFSWARLEPEPGRFTFGWLDRVLDLLADGGIKVCLATPTASPPPWFSLAHPDALPVTRDGVRLHHGSRDTYCASAPAYRAAAKRIAGALAERYRDHSALALWHVHNEYGSTCHCDHVAEAFRAWLRARYGDLDALNDAWTTAFWSQHYSDWAQVRTPVATQYLANPAQVLDFRRFCSDELLAAFVEQRDLLRAATPDVPVTTNYVLGGWVPVDHARWASEVDLVSIDHYPSEVGSGAEEQTAFAADLARGWAGGRPWLLMESAPNVIYTGGRMHTKEPGRMARHSVAHVARGSRGAMFFQWRAPRGGAELYHSAIVPHAGPDSRIFREAVALGKALGRITETDEGAVRADVALVWDAPSWWALQATHTPSSLVDYADEVYAAHRALWRAGHTVDVVPASADLSAYRLVVVPCTYVMSDATAAALRGYVVAGGHLVATYLSGVADECARIRLGGYPGALREVLGVRVEEFHPLAPDQSVALDIASQDDLASPPAADSATTEAGGSPREGRLWSESVQLAGARAVLSYRDGVLAGQPAVTRHEPGGAGVTWYVSTRLDDVAYQALLSGAARAAGAHPACPAAAAGVEVVRRTAGDRSWLFVLNHTDVPHVVPGRGVDLLTGAPVSGELTVAAGEFAVLREA